MAVVWTYDGVTTVTVAYDVPGDWGPGDYLLIFTTDPGPSSFYNAPANPGDHVDFTIPDITGLLPGDPFQGDIWQTPITPDPQVLREEQEFIFGTPFNFNPPAADLCNVFIDDDEVTFCAVEGSVTLRLNRPSDATVKLPMDCAVGDVGSYLRVYFNGVLYHHGRILQAEASADENTGYVVYNSTDPLELWAHRPVRDDDGDFTKPQLIETYVNGPEIIEAMFNNSIDTTAGGGGPPPSDAEGPLRLDLNSVTPGTASLVGAPVDWPMTMSQLAALLISTGEVDVVVTPIETDGNGNIGRLDILPGNYGMDLSSSVLLQYGLGARNVRAVRWNKDMHGMCNKLWYFLGPRVKSAADPAGDQHWRANIQGDDPGLAYPPGGGLSPPHSSTNNIIGVTDYASRNTYDVRMDIKVYDARGDEAIVAHDLYRRLWQIEQFLRASPLQLVHVTPIRGDDLIGVFNPGDVIGVEATTDFFGGFSGAQRIYEFTISWDQDSVPAISELQVSSDQEAFE